MAFLVLGLKFGAALLDLQRAAGGLREIQDIRIGFFQIARACHDKLLVILIQQKLHVIADGPRGRKVPDRVLVLLAIGELLRDLRLRAVAPLAEPGRELGRALLAHVAVFKFPVAQKADLTSAEVAIFLIKQTHLPLLSPISGSVVKQ